MKKKTIASGRLNLKASVPGGVSDGASETTAGAAVLPQYEHRLVKHAAIRPDPEQPRKVFSEEKLKELAESIRQKGIVQPLVLEYVPPKFKLLEPDLHNDKWRVEERCAPGEGFNLSGKMEWELMLEDTEAECRGWLEEKDETSRSGELRSAGLVDSYRIVCGERRWRAAKLLDLAEVPANVYPALTKEQRFALQFIENNQRENLSALEEASALQKQLDDRRKVDPTFSPEKLAAELGMSRAAMYERLKLNRLTPAVREALVKGVISTSMAGEIAKIPTVGQQKNLLKEMAERARYRPMSVRDLQQVIEDRYVKPLKDAPFDVKLTYGNSNELLQPCEDCPHRTGNMVNEFPELKARPHVCTNLECYGKKVKEAGEALAAQKALEGIGTMAEAEYEKNSEKFVKADDTNYNFCGTSGYKSWGTLMGKHKPKPVLVLTEDGPLEVYRKEEAQLALKANGVKLTGGSSSNGENKKYLAFQRKKKEMTAAAQRAGRMLLEKLVPKEPRFELVIWKMLAKAAFDHCNIEPHDFVAKARGLSERCNDSREALQKWFKAEHTSQEYAAMMMDLLLVAAWNGGGWQSVNWDDDFLALCKLAGGTPEKLAAEVEKKAAAEKSTANQQLMEGIGAKEVKSGKKKRGG